MKTKMFFLVVMLLCRGVAYAYSPSVNVPISKVEGIEQDIPPPHVTPPPLPSQVFLHVGEIAEIPYPMFGAMVWECDNPPEGTRSVIRTWFHDYSAHQRSFGRKISG